MSVDTTSMPALIQIGDYLDTLPDGDVTNMEKLKEKTNQVFGSVTLPQLDYPQVLDAIGKRGKGLDALERKGIDLAAYRAFVVSLGVGFAKNHRADEEERKDG